MDYDDCGLYVGYLLSENEAMEIFGAEYEIKLHEKCPKDKTPNPDKKNFCGNCGTDLKYKKLKRKGVEDLYEIAELREIKKSGLDVRVLGENGDSIVIGKCIADSYDMKGDVTSVNRTSLQKIIETLEAKLPKVLGITNPVALHFVSYTH